MFLFSCDRDKKYDIVECNILNDEYFARESYTPNSKIIIKGNDTPFYGDIRIVANQNKKAEVIYDSKDYNYLVDVDDFEYITDNNTIIYVEFGSDFTLEANDELYSITNTNINATPIDGKIRALIYSSENLNLVSATDNVDFPSGIIKNARDYITLECNSDIDLSTISFAKIEVDKVELDKTYKRIIKRGNSIETVFNTGNIAGRFDFGLDSELDIKAIDSSNVEYSMSDGYMFLPNIGDYKLVITNNSDKNILTTIKPAKLQNQAGDEFEFTSDCFVEATVAETGVYTYECIVTEGATADNQDPVRISQEQLIYVDINVDNTITTSIVTHNMSNDSVVKIKFNILPITDEKSEYKEISIDKYGIYRFKTSDSDSGCRSAYILRNSKLESISYGESSDEILNIGDKVYISKKSEFNRLNYYYEIATNNSTYKPFETIDIPLNTVLDGVKVIKVYDDGSKEEYDTKFVVNKKKSTSLKITSEIKEVYLNYSDFDYLFYLIINVI
jgi:hypothetical protein